MEGGRGRGGLELRQGVSALVENLKLYTHKNTCACREREGRGKGGGRARKREKLLCTL